MKITFTLHNASITVSHEPCSWFSTPADEIILLVAEQCTPNMLTRIDVTHAQWQYVVYVHWEHHTAAEWVGVLLDETTLTLFVGAGKLAASVDLRARQIVHQHTIDLFWHFERRGRFVVEFGELDYFLYDQNGALVDSAPVDPPYDYFDTPDGIRFESINYGSQWLKYPVESGE